MRLSLSSSVLTLGLVATIGIGLTACSSGETTAGSSSATGAPAPASSAATALPAATAPVDSVTWGYYATLRTLDPAKSQAFTAGQIIANICEPMLRIQPDFSVTDGLVAATNPTPTTWELKLHSGAVFTDGNPVTAEDVAYSLQRHLDPATASNWASLFASVQAIAVTAPDVVTVTLNTPDALFEQVLATMAGAVVEQAATQQAGQDMGAPGTGVVCAGPYSVASWESGGDLTLTKNSTYWDSANAPKVSTLVVRGVVSGTAQTNGLSTGELQGMYDVPYEGVSTLSSGGSGTLYTGASTSQFALRPIRPDGPMANPKVRLALSLALDRAALAEQILPGVAAASTHLWTASAPMAAGDPAATTAYQDAPASVSTGPDVEKAKQLVTESGYTGEPIKFVYTSGVSATIGQIATYVQQAGKDVGLNIELNDVAPQVIGQLSSDPAIRAQYDLGFTLSAPTLPDPLFRVSNALLPTAPGNYLKYDNPTVTADLIKAQQTSDPAARAALVLSAEQAAANDSPLISVLDMSNLLYLSNTLTGIPLSSINTQVAWAAQLGAK